MKEVTQSDSHKKIEKRVSNAIANSIPINLSMDQFHERNLSKLPEEHEEAQAPG